MLGMIFGGKALMDQVVASREGVFQDPRKDEEEEEGGVLIDDTLPGSVWIGSVHGAQNAYELGRVGITHVLCLEQEIVPLEDVMDVIQDRWVVPLTHEEGEDIVEILPLVFGLIDGVRREGGHVLVHCNRGINRSGAVVVAYVMARFGLGFEDGKAAVRRIRKVCPDDEYESALRGWRTNTSRRSSRVSGESE